MFGKLKFILICLPALFFVSSGVYAAPAASDRYVAADPLSTNNAADYLVITPSAFMTALEPLLDKRAADGLRVAVALKEDIYRAFPGATGAAAIREFIGQAAALWRAPAPRYLLLIGDTNATAPYQPDDASLPTFLVPTLSNPETASDNPYADLDGDALPDMAVGRIPADTPQELTGVIDKILAYETHPAPGPWRRRANVFASEGHFGRAMDSMLEEMFKRLVRHNVSPNFSLSMTYAYPSMPYFYIPDQFGQKVIGRFNEGALFMVYIGHGQVFSLDNVRYENKSYPIMEVSDVPEVNPGAMKPFLFIIACHGGAFHLELDGIGEQLLKSPNGPMGVFASSEVSAPYSNSILAKNIAFLFLKQQPAVVGDGIVQLKRALMKHFDEDRKLIDRQAQLFMTKKELVTNNRDHLFLYNYLGDPATRIAYPDAGLIITAPANAAPGQTVSISIGPESKRNARLLVTLECQPTEIIHDITPIEGLEGKTRDDAIQLNYANANNKIAASAEVENSTSGEVQLTIPNDLPHGAYYIKAYTWGDKTPDAMGYTEIYIQ